MNFYPLGRKFEYKFRIVGMKFGTFHLTVLKISITDKKKVVAGARTENPAKFFICGMEEGGCFKYLVFFI